MAVAGLFEDEQSLGLTPRHFALITRSFALAIRLALSLGTALTLAVVAPGGSLVGCATATGLPAALDACCRPGTLSALGRRLRCSASFAARATLLTAAFLPATTLLGTCGTAHPLRRRIGPGLGGSFTRACVARLALAIGLASLLAPAASPRLTPPFLFRFTSRLRSLPRPGGRILEG
jgi:hypothetical protein